MFESRDPPIASCFLSLYGPPSIYIRKESADSQYSDVYERLLLLLHGCH